MICDVPTDRETTVGKTKCLPQMGDGEHNNSGLKPHCVNWDLFLSIVFIKCVFLHSTTVPYHIRF